jgi:hypothetical protein
MEFPLIRTAESLGLPVESGGARQAGMGQTDMGQAGTGSADTGPAGTDPGESRSLFDVGQDFVGGDEPRLRFEETIPRGLVHRASVTEVFLTDSAVVGDDVFVVAAQLPRGHLFGERRGFYDFALIVETLRQTGIYTAHRHLDVPLDMAFIFRHLTVKLVDLDALRIGPAPAKVVITFRVEADRSKGGRVRAMRYEGVIAVDGRPALEADGALTFLTRGAFKALRSRHRAALDLGRSFTPLLAGASPDTVGRGQARNVVITEPVVLDDNRATSKLVVDLAHPHLFDHPLDHIPGNLQIEAARQIATAAVARVGGLPPDTLDVVAMHAEFTGFLELDLEARADAQVQRFRNDERLGVLAVPVSVVLEQQGEPGARVDMEVAQWR